MLIVELIEYIFFDNFFFNSPLVPKRTPMGDEEKRQKQHKDKKCSPITRWPFDFVGILIFN